MCDTFVVLPKFTKNGKMLFGKNSDREPDETQNIVFLAGKTHQPGDVVKCTYIEVPQAEETLDVILSQPFWMFGGEMGVNQAGVVIGNEAVFTTEPLEKNGLTGMDILRLALERQPTAKGALECIISLLDTYGQGGNCGYHDKHMYYHNSFIIADVNQAFVLETAGKHWVWKEIDKTYSISNVLTIESDFDGISPDAIKNAINKGRCESESKFSFRAAYIARGLNMPALKNRFAKGDARIDLHNGLICKNINQNLLDVWQLMQILRSHQSTGSKIYNPEQFGSMGDVCMHSALSLFRPSASVNSMVVESDENLTKIWTTCGSAPCIQTYKPLFLSKQGPNSIPNLITIGKDKYSNSSIWWRNELLHRLVLQNYAHRLPKIIPKRDSKELEWITESLTKSKGEYSSFCNACFEEAEQMREEWLRIISKISPVSKKSKYSRSWDKLNQKNQIPI